MIGSKLFYLTILAVVCLAFCGSLRVRGGHRELSGEQFDTAVRALDVALAKLATGDGPSYKAVSVSKVTTTQVVAGSLDTYTVELKEGDTSRQCTVKIWSQPWLEKDGTNVKINCEGSDNEVNTNY